MALVAKKYAALFANSKIPSLQQETEVKTIPAPVGGWDAISPLSNMEQLYAVSMINWVPRPGYLELRGGYNAWAQAITDEPVNSLMVYRPSDGSERLFAASGNEIWECTDYGLPTLAFDQLLSDKLQYINFTPAGGTTRLCMVNGSDPYMTFDGTNWVEPTITGVNSSTFINIDTFKRRIWFVPVNSTSAYYLDTDAIQGPATEFSLGSIFSKGSYLMATCGWTIDGGSGPDDYMCFISNKGQIALYRGTDPENSSVWVIIGVFDIAQPIGRRCTISFGSDVYIITTVGLIPISKTLPFEEGVQRSSALTNRIQNAMMQAAVNRRFLFGWECCSFYQQALLLLNVPIAENQQQEQYVMNTITGAWTKFTGWNANTFAIFNDSLYFGDNNGNVNLAFAGSLDLTTPIFYEVRCAFNYFDAPGRLKNMTMIRAYLYADGTVIPTIGVDVDYDENSISAPVTILEASGGVWDVSTWGPDGSGDVGIWSLGARNFALWQSAEAVGTAMSVVMGINLAGGSTSTVSQVLTESVFDTGVFDSMVFDGNGVITQSGDGIPILQVNAFQAVLGYGNPV